MAIISGYTSLLTAVGDYLARDQLTSYLPNFVQNMEEKFYRDASNWARWMETDFSATVSSNVAALPSNYLDASSLYVSGYIAQPLKRISLDQLYARYPRSGDVGVPMYFSRSGSNLVFGPLATNGLVISGTYFAKPTALRVYAADAAAHWLIVNAPDILLYGSLLEAMPFLIDDSRVMLWKSMYDDAIRAYREMFTEEQYHQPVTVAM